jgi:predicted dehydrogenase
MKVGVIGVGKLGAIHCQTLAQLPDVELAGVHDILPARCAEIAKKYRCHSYQNPQDLIEAVDAVAIAVPTSDHLEIARLALERRRSILIEKPIARTVEQAEEMVRLAAEKGVILQVGHIERFNPAIRAIDHMALEPMFIESHRLAPFDPRGTDVAVVLDLMIHDIDILLSLVKHDPVQIDANGVAVVSEAIDIANARIRFANGCVANVTASRISQRKMRKMRLFQRDAYISIDFLQRLTEVFRIVDGRSDGQAAVVLGQIEQGSRARDIIYDRPAVPADDGMSAEWRSFITSIRDGIAPQVSGEDGLAALKVACEIIKIIKNGL